MSWVSSMTNYLTFANRENIRDIKLCTCFVGAANLIPHHPVHEEYRVLGTVSVSVRGAAEENRFETSRYLFCLS
jgi:hypothetical protein